MQHLRPDAFLFHYNMPTIVIGAFLANAWAPSPNARDTPKHA